MTVNIEIHQPELEALIQQRLASGSFEDVEQVLLHALKSSAMPNVPVMRTATGTGLDLLAAMQAMPHRDEIDIEPPRPYMPVRDVVF